MDEQRTDALDLNTSEEHMGLSHLSSRFETYDRMVTDAKVIVLLSRAKRFILPFLLTIGANTFGIGEYLSSSSEKGIPLLGNLFWLLVILLYVRATIHVALSFVYVNRYRFKFDGDGVFVLSGIWNKTYETITQNRIQKVQLAQSFLQKINDLASLSISTAGGNGIRVEHLPLEVADREREKIIDYLNSQDVPI